MTFCVCFQKKGFIRWYYIFDKLDDLFSCVANKLVLHIKLAYFYVTNGKCVCMRSFSLHCWLWGKNPNHMATITPQIFEDLRVEGRYNRNLHVPDIDWSPVYTWTWNTASLKQPVIPSFSVNASVSAMPPSGLTWHCIKMDNVSVSVSSSGGAAAALKIFPFQLSVCWNSLLDPASSWKAAVFPAVLVLLFLSLFLLFLFFLLLLQEGKKSAPLPRLEKTHNKLLRDINLLPGPRFNSGCIQKGKWEVSQTCRVQSQSADASAD